MQHVSDGPRATFLAPSDSSNQSPHLRRIIRDRLFANNVRRPIGKIADIKKRRAQRAMLRTRQGSDGTRPHGGAGFIERLAAKLTAIDNELTDLVEMKQFGRRPCAQAVTFAACAVNLDLRPRPSSVCASRGDDIAHL